MLLVVIAVFAIALLVIVALPPTYVATAVVMVDTTHKDLLSTDDPAEGSISDSARVDGEVELVKSPATLLDVAKQTGLVTNPAFAPGPGLIDWLRTTMHLGDVASPSAGEVLAAVAARLGAATSVRRRGTTFLIEISVEASSAALSGQLANAVADSYIERQRQTKIDAVRASRDINGSQLADAEAAVLAADAATDDFILANLEAISQATGKAQLAEIRGELQRTDPAVAIDLPRPLLSQLYRLQQTDQLAQNQYRTLLARQKDLDVEVHLQVPDSRLAEAATPPLAPSSPNARLILAVASLLGLGLAAGAAFGRETLIGGFLAPADVRQRLDTPAVAAVPWQRAPKDPSHRPRSLADLLAGAPFSPFSESIRTIQFGVDQALLRRRGSATGGDATRGAVVMVSSAQPEEGKTTIALSLARAFSESGRTTLLIDGDLRLPRLHHHLRLEASSGLIDYLATDGKGPGLDQIIVNDPSVGLRVILGGRRSPAATDGLVTSGALGNLLEAARRHFDVVIIDTPAVNPAVDGLYLAAYADAVVFVLTWARTSQQVARNAIDALRSSLGAGVEIVAVLNQQRGRPPAGAGYYASNPTRGRS